MRVVITGSAGVVGTALTEELSEQGYDVIALSRADANLMNLSDACALFMRLAPEVIFHLAARVAGLGGNMAAPGEMFYENIVLNTNVIEAARQARVRKIVAAGTCAIYSDIVDLPMAEDDLWIGEPHSSEAAYGHAKRAMLAHLQSYNDQYGLDYSYAILTNVFGANDRFDEVHGHVVPSLISKFYRAIETSTSVTVWGTGVAERDFMYAKDVATALRLLAERGHGPFNVATGSQHSISSLVDAIKVVSGFQGDIVWDSTKPDGQFLRQYDVTRLAALGFSPQYSFEAAIQQTYDWYRGHPNLLRY